MAVRWSNPSGIRGIRRFKVWPDGTDSYNHSDLSKNWDTIDAIIGVPKDGTAFPATTGVDGGLYQEVEDLIGSLLPIGTMMAWVKTTTSAPVPLGFALCDGRIVQSADHDFPGIGSSVTMPDMRHRFILGADSTNSIGEAAVAITHGDINAAAGAPGPQGLGGANQVTLTEAQMAAHTHPGSKTGWSPLELHHYDNSNLNHPLDGDVEFHPASGSNATGTGVGGWQAGQHRHLINGLTTEGGDLPHENRPRHIGLVWIMKVKNLG